MLLVRIIEAIDAQRLHHGIDFIYFSHTLHTNILLLKEPSSHFVPYAHKRRGVTLQFPVYAHKKVKNSMELKFG